MVQFALLKSQFRGDSLHTYIHTHTDIHTYTYIHAYIQQADASKHQRKYQASPQGKAKRKDLDAKRQATSHRMATLHGKETTSGRPRAEGGELPHCQKRKALRRNVVRGV